MNAIPRFDFPCIPINSTFTVRLMISLTGEGLVSENPINIAMVIDRSGSMQGEKIAKVKEAACMIARMLKPADIFSLVAFNGDVETIVPSAKGADLDGVESLINKIIATGNTNLSGGYDRGFSLAYEGARCATSRIVLLSDGQANAGVLDPKYIALQAEKSLYQGVSTTTFGVGHDFDEELLTVLAERGGGSANYMKEPWEAAEVFREELEDLRSIAATRAFVRFTPAAPVVSCVQLNNFHVPGSNCWLVGDVYGTKDRRVILEMVVKTGLHTGEINVGSINFTYTMPQGEKPIELTVPVAINVVAENEFKAVTPDKEISIEAALLTVGRAKREASRLASEGKYIQAATLLENYISVLSGLCLNDPILDRELERLKEKAWNLRNRGEQFFTAVERKSFVYEADLAMKGRKDKYEAMMTRQDPVKCTSDGNGVNIASLLPGHEKSFSVDNAASRTVSDFLAEIFRKFHGAVETGSYGKLWLLRDAKSKRTFDIGTSWARSQGKQKDTRKLDEVGLAGPLWLEAIPLPRMEPIWETRGEEEYVRIMLYSSMVKEIEYLETALTCDFLATVYEAIRDQVPPNSYGKRWVLRDTANGRVFDFGSAWARAHNLQTDTRPIGKVGVRDGSVLEVVTLQQR